MTDLPIDILWVRASLGILLGLIFGSFITMLGYRLPRRLNIALPRSHCPVCQHTLGLIDLVPVFSWLMHSGKCRYCKTPISRRYPLIEALTAVLFGASFALLGLSYAAAGTCLIGSICLTMLSARLSR